MKYIITILLIFGYFTNLPAQIEIIKSDENYILGEVRDGSPSKYNDYNSFVASLSYKNTKEPKLYTLMYLGQSGFKEKIDFFATDKDINQLYYLILNDFSKPPGEFETIIKLGDKEIKIHVSLAKREAMANSGIRREELDFSLGREKLFSLNKEQLKKLFNK